MKQSSLLATVKQALPLAVAILLVAITSVSNAAEKIQDTKDSQANKTLPMRPSILYKPPLYDTPQSEVSRSTESKQGETSLLQVLAPDHTGLTLQSQPTLYWYASTPIAVKFAITVMDKQKTKPLLELDFKKAAGIQQLDLGKHGITLQPKLSYQWSVIPVMDKNNQSITAIASGLIERIEPGEGLSSRIKKSHGTELVNVYAIEGIWYDALETISSMIDKSPEDPSLVAIRLSLLEQVGVQIAAKN